MPLQITPLTPDAFDSIRTEWNDLLARSASDSIFLRWEWIHTWWRLFQQNKRLLILTIRDENRLVGIAPFYIERSGRMGSRVLKFCSDELSPDYLDCIAEKGREAEVAQDIVNALIQRRNEWDLLSFDNLRLDSSLLKESALFTGYRQSVEPSLSCPYIPIQGTFEDYYKTRPTLGRFLFEKKLKVLRDEMRVTHHVINDEPGFSKGLSDLFHLHELRASDKYVQSNFLAPEVKRFHQEVGRSFLQERILNLQILYQGDVPISAIYGFNYKNKTSVYQTGFDPAWKKWSAGGVLWYLAIRKTFEEGFAEFDFLKGVEPYKRLWTDVDREQRMLTVYNKNVRGLTVLAWGKMKEALRVIRHRTRSVLQPASLVNTR